MTIDLSIFDDIPDFEITKDSKFKYMEFKGVRFALTGSIGSMPRGDVETRIRNLGGIVSPIASADFLIVGDLKQDKTSIKIKSAEKKNIPIMDANDFLISLLGREREALNWDDDIQF